MDEIALFESLRFKIEICIIYYLYGRRFNKDSSREDQVKRILEFTQDKETRQRMLSVILVKSDAPAPTKMEHWRYVVF
jgi:hypothetical protein